MRIFIFILFTLFIHPLMSQQIEIPKNIKYSFLKIEGNIPNLNFPDMNQRPMWPQTVNVKNNNLEEVYKAINQMDGLRYQDIHEEFKQVDQRKQQTANKGTCIIKTYSMKESQNQFISNDFNNDANLPGSILQLYNNSNIYDDVLAVSIPPAKRNPFYLKIGNGINFTQIKISDPNQFKTLLKSNLSALISNIHSPVVVYFKSSKQTKQVLKSLGLNSKIYGQLGLTAQNSANINTDKVGKLTFIFFQKFFSAAVDLPLEQESTLTPVELFLTNQYSLDDLYRYVKFGFWGQKNPPAFVSQVNYGRYFILTVDQTEYTISLFQKLNVLYKKLEDNRQLEQIISSLLAEKSALTFSRGLFTNEKQGIKNINDFLNFFVPITNQLIQNNVLQPLSFSAINFMGAKIMQTELRLYKNVQCKKSHKVILRIKKVTKQVRVTLKRKEDNNFNTFVLNFNSRQGGSYEITNMLSQQNELKLTVRGQPNWFLQSLGSRYSSQMQLQIQINGKVVEKKQTGCKRCKSEFKDYYCQINLTKQTAHCK